MLHSIRKIVVGLGLMALTSSVTASAQTAHFDNLDQNNNIGMTAGATFTIPLGARRDHTVKDKTRFGFTLSFDRAYQSRNFATHNRFSTNVLELGFRMDGKPNLMMYGEDIYTPLFAPLYANDEETPDNGQTGSNPPVKVSKGEPGGALILLGGLVIAGTVVALNEAADDISDCFLTFNDDPKCD